MNEFCLSAFSRDEHGKESLYFSPVSAFDSIEVADETEEGIDFHREVTEEFNKSTLKITIKDKKE